MKKKHNDSKKAITVRLPNDEHRKLKVALARQDSNFQRFFREVAQGFLAEVGET
jgi:predicted DNA binding CopG/RHH family protein